MDEPHRESEAQRYQHVPACQLHAVADAHQQTELEDTIENADALRLVRYALKEGLIDELMLALLRMRFGLPASWPERPAEAGQYTRALKHHEIGQRFGYSKGWSYSELERTYGALRLARRELASRWPHFRKYPPHNIARRTVQKRQQLTLGILSSRKSNQ